VESLVSLKRNKEFKSSKYKPVTIKDSRFGIRKFYLNANEEPSIGGIYAKPGRGQRGEHQN
jgi:hypothetical protein